MNIDRKSFDELYESSNFFDIRSSVDATIPLMMDLISDYDVNSKKIIYNGVEFEVSEDGKTLLSCSKDIEFFDIPDTVEFIADRAFSGCSKLEKIVIPEHVKAIGVSAFERCNNLVSVEIKGPIEKLITTFLDCKKLKEVKLPNTLKEMSHTFSYCSSLNNIELPESLELIGPHCFANSGIVNINIPKNVVGIDTAAFWECMELVSCTFDPKSKLEFIGDSAFAECINLSGAELSKASLFKQHGYDIVDEFIRAPRTIDIVRGDLRVHYKELQDLDKLTTDHVKYPFILPNSVKRIGSRSFQNSGLTEFEVPSLVTEIPDNAFKNCINLKHFFMHDKVYSVGNECFKGCKILENFEFGDNVYEIGSRCFADCEFLREVKLPSILAKIPDELFHYCSRLVKVKMPFVTERIGSKAFYRCGNLKNIYISPKVSFIADDAFLDCYINEIQYGQIGFKKKRQCEINEVFSCVNREELMRKIKLVSGNGTNFHISLPGGEYSLDCSKILSVILNYADSKELYKNVICKFNLYEFTKNIMFFKENNLDYLDFCNSVISYGNYGLLFCDIEKAFKNYDYLLQQNILNRDLLNKIYFENATGNNAKELFLDYIRKNGMIPDLFRTLLVDDTDKNKLELRDRLVYVSTMQLLDGNYSDEKYDKAIVMLKRTLFDNIVANDKKHMSVINDDIYSEIENYYPEMVGMMSTFYNKINGIDSSWFSQLFREIKIKGNETKFKTFYNSLTTVKYWNEFDNDVERVTLLKNEIIGRLIYADIMLTMGSNAPKKDAYIRTKSELIANNNRIDIGDLLEFASKDRLDLFKNSEAITTMLMIDPYAFDALRRGPGESSNYKKKDLDVKNARLAIAHGYIFEEEELSKYRKVRNDSEFDLEPTIERYVECILNGVGCAKIPEEDKETYLNNMRKQIKIYIKEQSEDELFKFCRSFDLYLRNNNEYVVQGKDSSTVAKEMFDVDGEYSNDARVMYCLYNLNRIAHNSLELNCKAAIKNKFRLSTDQGVSYDRMEKIFDSYNRLYRCGIDSELVSILLDKDSPRGITDFIFSDESSMSQSDIFNKDSEIASILNRLNISDVRENPITVDEVSEIKLDLKNIYSMNDAEREIIATSVLEQNTFFECKRMFSEEMINRIASEFSNDMIKAMGATIDEKREFYAKHGYVVEIQGDLGNEVLVCLCEAFNEPFSVHLKDLPDNVVNALRIVPRTNTIAHCSLDGRSLSFRDSDYESKVLGISDIGNYTGFKSGRANLESAQRSNYDNYDVYAKQIRQQARLDDMFNGDENSNINTNTGNYQI